MKRLGPPGFWYAPPGIKAWVLRPFERVTRRVAAVRLARKPFICGVPVLCCGNATVGGTGKTIAAIDFTRRLIARGKRPHILTRGYGGKLKGPVQVDPAQHDATLVGDEPLLLAAVAPTWIGGDRAETARRAIQAGADCLVMDDGFQNRTLAQDFSILVVDGATGFGNQRVLPAGPMREPIQSAFARAHVALVIGNDRGLTPFPSTLWRVHAWIEPELSVRALAGRRVVAFAGIGRPSKFFASLSEAGITPVRTLAFPDHHAYGPKDIARLHALADQNGIILATTEKDAVKLPDTLRKRLFVVRVGLRWADRTAPERILDRLLTR